MRGGIGRRLDCILNDSLFDYVSCCEYYLLYSLFGVVNIGTSRGSWTPVITKPTNHCSTENSRDLHLPIEKQKLIVVFGLQHRKKRKTRK